jgi:hypothetical protein
LPILDAIFGKKEKAAKAFSGYDYSGRAFNITIPPSWRARAVIGSGPELFVKDGPGIDFRRRPVEGSARAVRDWAQSVLHELRNSMPDFGLLEVWRLNIAGREAFELDYLFKNMDKLVRTRHIVTRFEEELCELVMSAPDDAFEGQVDVFDAILSTSKWGGRPDYSTGRDAASWLSIKTKQRQDGGVRPEAATAALSGNIAGRPAEIEYIACEFRTKSQQQEQRRTISGLVPELSTTVDGAAWIATDPGGVGIEEKNTAPPKIKSGISAVDPSTGIFRPVEEFLGLTVLVDNGPGVPVTDDELKARIAAADEGARKAIGEGVIPAKPKTKAEDDPRIVPFTDFGLGFIPPEGWTLKTENKIMLSRGGMRIDIRKENINGHAVPVYAHTLLKTIRQRDDLTLIENAQAGKVDGRPAFGLDLIWRQKGSREPLHQRHALIGNDYLLYFVLRSPAQTFMEGCRTLAEILSTAKWYHVEDMTTKVTEGWLKLDLGRGWTRPAEGIYINHGLVSNSVFVKHTKTVPEVVEQAGQAMYETALKRPDAVKILAEIGGLATFRGIDAFRFAVDAENVEGKPICARGTLFFLEGYAFIIQTQSIAPPETADEVYRKFLEAIDLPGLQPPDKTRYPEFERKKRTI